MSTSTNLPDQEHQPDVLAHLPRSVQQIRISLVFLPSVHILLLPVAHGSSELMIVGIDDLAGFSHEICFLTGEELRSRKLLES
jgi:hypothetical protein